MKDNLTIQYYNENAEQFINTTLDVNFTEIQDEFLSMLRKESYILDFGCGSGRDTKYFLERGFVVDAVDGSLEMCKRASEVTGIRVKHMLFDELNEINKYEAIWACSSILHLSYMQLVAVFNKMLKALKADGIIYTSFKYGDFEGFRNGRYFIDFDEEKLERLKKDVPALEVEKMWITTDVRPGRDEEKWMNLILKKK
ncbi:class I SAM-dependent methyltransferase [Traorella massiliensis]|uniref:class I SAM-dependent methyltransferase n=1 Tax=Traorella massiliensis TaxID=1903263 RepID=UPI00248EF3C0|nr:class I SAM-dependent methyltransferase [Traorella massiliensis]